MFEVKRAKRQKLKAAVALLGASGSGKTVGGLFTGYGMMEAKYPDLSEAERWEKVGFVDTEHGRSLVYADIEKAGVHIGEFLHINLTAPFNDVRYDAAVKALKDAGAEVIIIDSISHAWEGEGGFLDMQDKYGGNFQAWNKVKPHIKNFIKTLTENDVHIIATMRTKQDYQVETSETGKLNIRKLGLKPIQKDDLEYEFQVVWQVDEKHIARTTKDNSGLFEGSSEAITPETGRKLFQWLEEGIDVKAEEEKDRQNKIDHITELREINPEIEKVVKELETKAKTDIPDMKYAWVKKAFMLVEGKLKEIESGE